MDATDDDLAWTVRRSIYAALVERGVPPSVEETAVGLGIAIEAARAAYRRLDALHAIFLEPGTETIRMAHPFSGVPTPFRVRVGDRAYWANCAWDALGVPAALGADATVEAVCADDGLPAEIGVVGGVVQGKGELVHFLRPFRRWYDDLVFT